MGFALNLLLTATPPPGGDLREGLNPDQVSPGLPGFIATFAVVAVTILLILDMTRRIRRVRYQNQEESTGVLTEGDNNFAVHDPASTQKTDSRDDADGTPSSGPAPNDPKPKE